MSNKYIYRIFSSYDEKLLIDVKLSNIFKSCEKLNDLFDLKDINCEFINIPMIDNINIINNNNNINIDINNFNIVNYSNNDNIFFSQVKKNDNIEFKDIIINYNDLLISLCIYKLNKPILNITHGVIIIYKSFNNYPNMIYFTKSIINNIITTN